MKNIKLSEAITSKSLVKGGWTVQSHEIICAAPQVILLAGEQVTAAQLWVIASQDNCALIWISMNRQERQYLYCSSGKKSWEIDHLEGTILHKILIEKHIDVLLMS